MEKKTQGICLRNFYKEIIHKVNDEVKKFEEHHGQYTAKGKICFILYNLSMYLGRQSLPNFH